MALWTDQRALQLTLEEIYNDGIVPLFVAVPAFSTQFSELDVATSRLPIRLFDVRLLLDTIEIFVQAIEQEGYELLRVVLPIAGELRGESGCGPLQLPRAK